MWYHILANIYLHWKLWITCLLVPFWFFLLPTVSWFQYRYILNLPMSLTVGFLFNVLIFIYMFSFLFLLSCQFGITYWFWELLCIEVYYIIPTLNLWQNTLACCHFLCLNLLEHSYSLSSVLICNLLQSVLLCHICNIFLFLFLYLISGMSLLMCYS